MTHARGDYEHGDSLDWRDHEGLAHKVAFDNLPTLRAYNLEPDDVIPSLIAHIAYCLDGRFDPDRGFRVSTYLMLALKRFLLREIAIQHGYGCFKTLNNRKWRTQSVGDASMISVTMVASDPPVWSRIVAEETNDELRKDLEWLIDNAGLNEEDVMVLELRLRGANQTQISERAGCSRGKVSGWERRAIGKLRAAADRLGVTAEDLG